MCSSVNGIICVCFYQIVFSFHMTNDSTESCIAGLVNSLVVLQGW